MHTSPWAIDNHASWKLDKYSYIDVSFFSLYYLLGVCTCHLIGSLRSCTQDMQFLFCHILYTLVANWQEAYQVETCVPACVLQTFNSLPSRSLYYNTKIVYENGLYESSLQLYKVLHFRLRKRLLTVWWWLTVMIIIHFNLPRKEETAARVYQAILEECWIFASIVHCGGC